MKKLLIICLAAASFYSQATINELMFTGTDNDSRAVVPSVGYINPTSAIAVQSIAGLDRKINLTVKNSAGSIIFNQTSGLITVSDKLTSSSGVQFYGKAFTVPTLAEGSYTFISTIYNSLNAVTSTNNYSLLVDKVKPSATSFGWSAWAHSAEPLADNTLIGPYESYRLWANLNADVSGIQTVTFEARNPTTNAALTNKPASYSPDANQVYIGNGSAGSVTNGVQFPSAEGLVKATFIVTDKAGNVGVLSKPVKWVGGAFDESSYQVVGIKKNNSYAGNFLAGSPFTGYQAYSAGVTSDINPISIVVRVKKTDWWSYNEYGISIGNTGGPDAGVDPDYTDATYVYKILTGTHTGDCFTWPSPAYQKRRLVYFAEGTPCHGVDLSSSAPKTPNVSSVELNISGLGWVANTGGLKNTPWVLLGIRATAEARTYEQHINFIGSTCLIAAGATSCNLNLTSTPKTFVSSTGVPIGGDYYVTATNAAGDINKSIGGGRYLQDPSLPVITSATHDGVKTITIKGNKPYNGALWGRVAVTAAGVDVEATNTINATKTTLNSSTFTIDTDGNYTGTINTSSLPDGKYTYTAKVTDTAGNLASKAITGTFTLDNTAPTLLITGDSDGVVSKLKNILILVTDAIDTAPTITSVTLTGGPVSDNLELGFSKQSDGWHLETPRLFPSLQAGEIYTLTVNAKDAQGNTTNKILSFSFVPENLVALGSIEVLAFNQSLSKSTGQAQGLISISGAKTESGTPATGSQVASFTLRKDAAYPVVFGGVVVQAGETKDVTVSLSAQGGASLLVYPAVTGTTGSANFMLDFPQLVAN